MGFDVGDKVTVVEPKFTDAHEEFLWCDKIKDFIGGTYTVIEKRKSGNYKIDCGIQLVFHKNWLIPFCGFDEEELECGGIEELIKL